MKIKLLFCFVVVMKRVSNLLLFGKGVYVFILLNMDLYKFCLELILVIKIDF